MDIGTAVASVSAAIDTVKFLRDTDKKLDQAEVRAQLAEVYSALADTKMALADAKEEIQTKDEEIERLRAEFQRKEQLVERHGYRYFTTELGNPKGLPVCARCEELEGRLIVVHQIPGATRGDSYCPHCKNKYECTEYLGDPE